MEVHGVVGRSLRSAKIPSIGDPWTSLRRAAAVVLLILLGGAGAVIAGRGLAGAFVQPLPPAGLLIAIFGVAALSIAIRLGWLEGAATGCPRSAYDWAVMSANSLATAAALAGLCLSEASWFGPLVAAFVFSGQEFWAWRRFFRRGTANPPDPGHWFVRETRAAGVECGESPATLSDEDDLPPEEVVQQLTRSQAADGSEDISGWLRMSFLAGQRTGSLHVAFCPPLGDAPELLVEQVDGPEARIKTAQLLPYGARLDLKLAVAAEQPTTVLLQFSARAPREKS